MKKIVKGFGRKHINLGKLALVLALLLIGGQAWGATYYAAKVAGTWRYASENWPTGGSTACTANDIEGCMSSAGANNTIVLATGVYATTDLDSADGLDSVASGQTLRGPVSAGSRLLAFGYTVDPPHASYNSGPVVLDGTGLSDHLCFFSQLITLANLTLIAPDTSKRILTTNTATGYMVKDCIFQYSATVSHDASTLCSTVMTFLRCTFQGYGVLSANPLIQINAGHTLIFSNCIFYDNSRNIDIYGGTLSLFNCLFYRSGGSFIRCFSASSTINIINTIFVAGGTYYNEYPILTANSDLTIKNSIVQPSVINPITYTGLSGTYTDGGGNIGLSSNGSIPYPSWVKTEGYYDNNCVCSMSLLFVDSPGVSSADFAQWKSLVQQAGFRGTIKLLTSETDSDEYAVLQAAINDGFEVALQGKRYVEMGKTGTGIAIQYVGGAGSCSSTTDTSAGTITTSAGASWTLSNYTDLTALVAAIDGHADYTCSLAGTDAYAGGHFPLSLTDGTKADIKTSAQTILVDRDKMHILNIGGGIGDVAANLTESGLPYVVKSFIHPGHEQQADTLTYLAANGIIHNYDASGSVNYILSDGVDMMAVYRLPASVYTTAPEISLSAFLQYAEKFGGMFNYYIHNFSGGTDATEYENVLKLLQKVNCKTLTMRAAATYILSLATGGSSRNPTFTLNGVPDYRLRSNSSAIGSGVLIPGLHDQATPATDFAGTPVTWGPSIGAYQPTDTAPIWANLNGMKLLRASQAVTITGDHSAEIFNLSDPVNAGTLTVTGGLPGKIIGNAAVTIKGVGQQITSPIELGDNVKMQGFQFTH